MQRIILNRLKYFKPLVQISRFEQTEATEYKHPFELNQIQLVGTIEHEVYKFKNNNILRFFLKTRNADGSHCVHKVNITNRNLLEKIGTNTLGLNQAIYIGGRLKSVPEQIEGRPIHISEIFANELYFLDEKKRSMEELNLSSSFDQNSVKILSRITSNLSVTKHISFTIGTHYNTVRNPGPDRGNIDFHRVLVDRNNNLFRTAMSLERGNRIYLEGCLDYDTYKIKDTGNEHVMSFIRPSVIVKFKKGEKRDKEISVEEISQTNT